MWLCKEWYYHRPDTVPRSRYKQNTPTDVPNPDYHVFKTQLAPDLAKGLW